MTKMKRFFIKFGIMQKRYVTLFRWLLIALLFVFEIILFTGQAFNPCTLVVYLLMLSSFLGERLIKSTDRVVCGNNLLTIALSDFNFVAFVVIFVIRAILFSLPDMQTWIEAICAILAIISTCFFTEIISKHFEKKLKR